MRLRDVYQLFISGEFASIGLFEVLGAVALEADKVVTRRHPLGFTHAELTPCVAAPVGERFRLHYWLDGSGTRDDLGDLHEHTWHLTSLVLAGSVLDKTLRAVPASRGAYRGSRIIYGDQNSSELVGQFDLLEVESRAVMPGSAYEIPSRTVHVNSVARLPTVTLVRSVEDENRLGPLVFNQLGPSQAEATAVRPHVPTLEAIAELTRAINSP